jgi:hypothetical protein
MESKFRKMAIIALAYLLDLFLEFEEDNLWTHLHLHESLYSLVNSADNFFSGKSHILGYSANSWQNWLLTPHKYYGKVNAAMKNYSYLFFYTYINRDHLVHSRRLKQVKNDTWFQLKYAPITWSWLKSQTNVVDFKEPWLSGQQ